MSLRLAKIFFFLLCLDVVIDPGNSIFNIKEALFIGTLLLGLLYCIRQKLIINKNVFYVCLFFGLFIPVYGVLVGWVYDQAFSSEYALMYTKSFLFIWLLVIQKTSISFEKYLAIASLFVIIPSLYLVITINAFDPRETYYFVQHKASFISRRYFAGIIVDPVIYYKTLSLSIFGIGWLLATLREKLSFPQKLFKNILLATILLVVFYSFSRAVWICAAILLLHHFYIKWKHKKFVKPILVILLLVVVFVGTPMVIQKIIFVQGEEANLVKFGHISSYLHLFDEQPLVLLIGQGLGGGFYSSGFKEITYMTEITYLELIRFFGVPLFIIIMLFLFYPLYFYHRNKNHIAKRERFVYLSFGLYLFCVATNPLLIGSTGMIVLVVLYSVVFKTKYQLSINNVQLNL